MVFKAPLHFCKVASIYDSGSHMNTQCDFFEKQLLFSLSYFCQVCACERREQQVILRYEFTSYSQHTWMQFLLSSHSQKRPRGCLPAPYSEVFWSSWRSVMSVRKCGTQFWHLELGVYSSTTSIAIMLQTYFTLSFGCMKVCTQRTLPQTGTRALWLCVVIMATIAMFTPSNRKAEFIFRSRLCGFQLRLVFLCSVFMFFLIYFCSSSVKIFSLFCVADCCAKKFTAIVGALGCFT